MAELSGNKWVKTFTNLILTKVKENSKGATNSDLVKWAIIECGIKQSTTERYLETLRNAGLLNYDGRYYTIPKEE